MFLKQAKQNFQSTDGLLYALTYIFLLTFICYPGLASDVSINFLESINNYDTWKILFIQGCFNLCDCIGRYCGGISCLVLNNFTIKLASTLRTLFLVTFLLVSFDVIT